MNDLTRTKPVVFTAHSKYSFFCRDSICAFVFLQGCVPLNPFRAFDYFLGDRVERDLVRQGNFNLLRIAVECWVFGGPVANGVLAEIRYAAELHKPVRFFTIGTRPEEIRPLSREEVERLELERELQSELQPDIDFKTMMRSFGIWQSLP